MQVNSSQLYARRSYPTNFLAGLGQFLVGAAATTVIATHSRTHQVLSPFTVAIAVFLLLDAVWLIVALEPQAGGDYALLPIAAGVGGICGAVVAIGTTAGIAIQIRTCENLDSYSG
jgi:hypothetical protein